MAAQQIELDIDETRDTLTEVHPALDVVGGVLYVTTWVPLKGKGLMQVVLSSKGDVFTAEAWQAECLQLGLIPMTDTVVAPKGRISPRVVAELQAGTLGKPSFRDVYKHLYDAFSKRLEVRDKRYLTVLTLFAMMTYFHPLFEVLPILHLRGPAGSGKSRAGGCVAQVAFNGVAKGNPSPSTMFRNVDRARYTYVVTEADNLADLDSGNRYAQQLQAGTTRTEANVDIAEGDKKFEPRTYFIFAPKVLCSTKPIKSHPLRTRCIRLDITRTANANRGKLRERTTDQTVWQPLRDDLYRLQLGKWQEVEAARDMVIERWESVNGRTFDNWLPLMTIAQCVGGDEVKIVKELAQADVEEHQDDAATTFEAILYKFAVVAFSMAETMTRDDLWRMFLHTAGNDDGQPIWAKATDAEVTVPQLRRWVRGKGALIKDLQRLELLDKAVKGRQNNAYLLDAEKARTLAAQYLGDRVEFGGGCGDSVEV